MKRICKQCGKEFELAESELNFYRKKNLAFPKRCKECRAANRAGSGRPAPQPTNPQENTSNVTTTVPVNVIQIPKAPKKKTPFVLGAVVVALLAVGAVVAAHFLKTPEESSTMAVLTSQPTQAPEESTAPAETTTLQTTAFDVNSGYSTTKTYHFRTDAYLDEHYEKHGIEMGFSSAEEYESAASAVVNNPAAEHKQEAEDNDDVYYLVDTNEFVIVSTDGYLRTYFNPDDGPAYFERQ